MDEQLQTIDGISVLLLADLLTQQDIEQIVLSTHEDTKANLLRYKFNKQTSVFWKKYAKIIHGNSNGCRIRIQN